MGSLMVAFTLHIVGYGQWKQESNERVVKLTPDSMQILETSLICALRKLGIRAWMRFRVA